ncbi:MAG TPA: PVC-type heme-binding CxxCH protein [Candidatus Limnocylindria bacterium]|nr:PVC-type heme-binding CxxCH protein [Candidatus Limnocylindria bacterium]
MNLRCVLASLLVLGVALPAAAVDPVGLRPLGKDGHVLNLDFETGDLRDWTATGEAFAGQPVKGDLPKARRADMSSQHTGEYWIGGFEKVGDDPKGTLTSASFKVTQPWASFRLAGGAWPDTRVELVDAATGKVFLKVGGADSETLRPVVVDVKDRVGSEIFIRLVDDRAGGWGHLNFDDFQLHAARPVFADEYSLAEARRNEPPPADTVLYAGLTPEKAAEVATLPPGFKLHVFAGEPDIKQPIAFCDDDRGRLWVIEGYTYPKRVGVPPKNGTDDEKLKDILGGKDRLIVFEDTDGDGKFDRRTVVLEGLNLVSGLEYGYGGVFIGAAPYLLFLPIVDGDAPKPAGPPQILLDGWNFNADTHETLNTFCWGPDGWLYGCHGVFCPSNVGKPGATETERQWMDAGVWRYHPTQRKFEVFAEGTSNPWGVDFDENGQCWIEACVIPHLYHMIQGGRYIRQGGEHFTVGAAETARNAKHREAGSRKPVFPYVYEDIQTTADHLHYAGNQGPHAGNGRSDSTGGGHAHAGMMVYLGASWPDQYRGKLIMGNIHGQRLNMDVPERVGSGYVGHHGADFLNFNDSWSQTLNQRYDADGSVYVIDWYDKNQCHHNNVDGHDRSNGRIYKIVYNHQPKTSVDLAKLNDEELVKLVPSKNEWMSRHARRLLAERAAAGKLAESARTSLRELMLAGRDTTTTLRALWAMHVTGGVPFEDIGQLVQSEDEFARGWAIQVAAEAAPYRPADHWSEEGVQDAIKGLAKLAASDPSPVVRRFVASAAQRLPVAQRKDVLLALAGHAEDIGDHNLPLLYWYAAEGAVATDPGFGLDLLRACKIPKIREFIARRLATASLASAQ